MHICTLVSLNSTQVSLNNALAIVCLQLALKDGNGKKSTVCILHFTFSLQFTPGLQSAVCNLHCRSYM